MTCDEARDSLSALLDQALTPDERRAVEAHLEGCAECRREAERLRQTVALLHGVAPAHAPVGFVDRVLAAARPRPWYRRIAAAVFLPLSAKLPAEATALIMVALLAAYAFERTPALREAARYEAPAPPARPSPSSRLTDARKEAKPAPAAPPASPGERVGRARRDTAPAQEVRPAASPPPAASTPPPAAVVPPPPASAPPPTQMPTAKSATPPAARSEAPPPPRTDAPAARADAPAESGQRSEAESRQKSLERAAGSTRVAPAAPDIAAAKRARPSADVVARVAVKDRDAAERDLAQLIAQVGGRQTERRREADATVVEAVVPQSRYAEFSQALTAIGPWRIEAERPDLPSQVHVILRLE